MYDPEEKPPSRAAWCIGLVGILLLSLFFFDIVEKSLRLLHR